MKKILLVVMIVTLLTPLKIPMAYEEPDDSGESENEQNGLPLCDCGGLIKPDVVLYEEGLDDFVVESAIKAISKADVLIIGGTSLVVYPAASFIDYYHGKKLVLINKSETMADSRANLVFHESLGEVLSSLQI